VLFVLGTLGVIAFIVGALLLVGRFYPGTSAELVHWEPTRSPEVEAQNEIDDVRQMLEAQNEMRRRRGAREMTAADLDAAVAEDQQIRMRGQGPFEPT
jgi:membrane-bound ClpP family serine protease